ncbi:DUF58 domain-containing protein [Chondromyces apiculatus]|uniref:DUF58 domain-containing protein n=1 Tax=Chondromyces apiculatus DSM 436 TaxID=1192034 RepID=A0A017T7M6_9BACT|nr:DUF58 domain-containing protein [Chondromyces apiculatus]EYF05273.1 Hypothetical protein CAP_3413 [Chondromyces apiculatus DSM 436]
MQLYPTRTAAHLAIVGAAVVTVGLVAREPAISGWGGAILVALALARAVTLVSVARIRAAGFEMLWTGQRRLIRAQRGGVVEIEAEVRNRDTLAARFVRLRAVASSQLDVSIEPDRGEVLASGRLKVKVKVRTPRVGHHGLHGLALEVHGAPGLFEVPLTFANPYGVEVLPRPFMAYLMQPRGGRSHLVAPVGRPGRSRGEGDELRELREHQHGDPFRKIAWKASSRRGVLLVRELEREERDVVWVVLDAAVELWAGPVGRAPLDITIDEAATIITRHLARGDRVGLVIFASGVRTLIQPDHGPTHGQKLAHAMLVGCSTYDADRSDLDEADAAVRVLEHLRPLDAQGLADVRRGDLDRLAARADAMRARAPFPAVAPVGRSPRDRSLRRYLASYGIESPPRYEPDRRDVAATVADALTAVARAKPRASIVHVLATPPPEVTGGPLPPVLQRLARRSAKVFWATPDVEPALTPPWKPAQRPPHDPDDGVVAEPARDAFQEAAPVAAEAVLLRARVAQTRREAALRRLGVRVIRIRPMAHRTPVDHLSAPEPTAPASPTSDDGVTG